MYARIAICAQYRTVVLHGSCTTRQREGAERAPPTLPFSSLPPARRPRPKVCRQTLRPFAGRSCGPAVEV